MASTQLNPPGNAPRRKQRSRGGDSLVSIAWAQFLKHPMARLALVILGTLYFLAAFADFFSPYPERDIRPYFNFSPPTRIHLRDGDGNWVRPFVYAQTQELDLTTFRNVWTVDTSERHPIRFFVRSSNRRDRYVPFPLNLIPPQIRQAVGIRPTASLRLFGVDDPNVRVYLWGSDDVGRDIFGQIFYGARISLTIGILASVVAIVVGMIMGGLAGFFGGWVDELIMRFVEGLSAIPPLFLLVALSAMFYPLRLPSSTVFALIVTVLAFIGWGGISRAVRGQILSLKEQEFAFAAKAIGANNWRVITKHLLPHTLSYVLVIMSLAIPGYILTEASLSFVGLGIQPPSTSWGLMLRTAQENSGVTGLINRWWIYIPGVFIFIAVISWNLLGDGLRDAFDPRSRK